MFLYSREVFLNERHIRDQFRPILNVGLPNFIMLHRLISKITQETLG